MARKKEVHFFLCHGTAVAHLLQKEKAQKARQFEMDGVVGLMAEEIQFQFNAIQKRSNAVMKKLMEMVIALIGSEFSQKNLVQTIIWKIGRMVESSEKTLDKVAAEIVALEAEIGDGERTAALESKENFLETVSDQIAELEGLLPDAKVAYKAAFNETYTEKAKTSKPRSSRVKALLAKKAAAKA